jgi:two-component system sensor histidine kinase QseC
LGIGLTLVERIAQSQGAQLVRDAGAAPFGKRFALVWPATGQLSGKA